MPHKARILHLTRHMASSAASGAPASFISVTPAAANGCTTRVVLNRAAKLNALNLEMVRDLVPVLRSLKPNSCLLMEGAGDRAFCAGGDVASIREEAVKGNLGGLPADFFFEEYHVDYWLSKLKTDHNVTQVSIWNGVCMGGGVGISVHGAIRVATEKTLFAMPEVGIGLFPDVGATYALPRLKAGKEVGLYLAATGARLGAKDCLFAGLATHYVPSNRLDVLRENLSKLGPSCSYDAVHAAIEAARGGAEPPEPKGTPLEASASLIKECFAYDSAEAIVARLQKVKDNNAGKPAGAWAESSLKAIMVASPLSVKLTIEALKRNGEPSVTLQHAFTVEYRLAQRAMLGQPHSDFLEGVRAVLVDKDKPKWAHKSLEDVKRSDVDAFFDPLQPKHPRGEFVGDIRGVLLKD